ncbi:DUF3089 domain-containing protein [Sphingomonas sabuli]|uniref:DUF3089 domain-containing protein n=1 Tax=Sphingomonas sabuli TaxID=2764186 RepID=A0A7G9L3S8_9SPHN|nr:DUF3089 domain-containing protein [Sphingomonas sabuli]QNM83277.1 DUF3089 domain-containing protein [Sphingomonas sabuli]
MYARRFLVFVTVLTLLAVVAAFAFFQWGGQALVSQGTPKGHFEQPADSAPPAYADAGLWLARPDIAGNPAGWLPDGYAADGAAGQAAVFYIHPTTYLRTDRWNAPYRDANSASRDDLFVRSQASAFNGVGKIWAPRYRQAAYGAFLLDSEDARQALDLAYRDVSAAFDEFLKQAGRDRPIVLAGHSQGALHLIRLLRERHAQLGNRLVAAYVVGWPIDTVADLPALGVPACNAPADTGCVLSWMTFGDPPNPQVLLSQWQDADSLAGGERQQDQVLCVNPITGKRDDAAPASANPGTLVPDATFTSASLNPGVVGARCTRGLLIADGMLPALGPFVLFGNNYHVYDYALFWGAIREDARRRLTAWQR